jgi:hypothetical protein
MLSQPASGFVGLIVIESSRAPDDVTAGSIGHQDATLGEILRWLARGMEDRRPSMSPAAAPVAAAKRPRLSVRRLSRRPLDPEGPARVAADCRGLGAQLERAARQLRQRIATAQSDAR